MVVEVADSLRPQERLTVSEAAEKYVYIDNPGQYRGFYKNNKAPYMIEPQDTLKSRLFREMIFCGPAQCGKTQSLLLNWLASTVMTQPMDMVLYSPTQANARDFSVRRIDRLHSKSPVAGQKSEVGKHMLARKDADNKTDKQYDNGMILTLSWPTVNELAGKPIGLVGLTDYDRMDDDIDGDGSPFSLASKRTTTFKSFGMTMAESSPSRPIEDLKWIRKTPHEAPPCKGILGLYNDGDRRRWYWPCPKCRNHFVGNFKMLEWDGNIENAMDAADTVRLRCPFVDCGYLIHPDQRYQMNMDGLWLAEGQSVDRNGKVFGEAIRSLKASYWLDGTAASFSTWQYLVITKITADRDYERTGDEEKLRKFYNNDLAEPYVPKSMETIRLPEMLMNRAETFGTLDEPVVPRGVRFLLALVDVQQNMFIVQIMGIAPGTPFDMVVIDRYQIRMSNGYIPDRCEASEIGRLDSEGQIEWVKPGVYAEDWDLLISRVMERSYPLADGSGRRMTIKMTGCDSGGKVGVTANAYAFYRRLRARGIANRIALIKGIALPTAPRTQISYPDSSNRDMKAAAQGDVPILLLQSNMVKDMLSGRLDSLIPGAGMIRFPDWLPDWFYGELCAEIRTEKGWTHPKGNRNEAWDLCYYAIGLCISPLLGVEQYDWKNPPVWATDWDNNPLVTTPDKIVPFANQEKPAIDFGALARTLA